MTKPIDHYPEVLLDLYDKLVETVAETVETPPAVDVPLQVTEWIRKHWSRRYLIPSWWGPVGAMPEEPQDENLPGVVAQVDPLRTARGRELRDVICSIILGQGLDNGRPCYLATAIAERVELEWSHSKIYVPRAAGVDRAIRDAQVWREFCGGMADIERIVEKHNLSQSAIYDAYRRLQKDKAAREQPTLPGF